LWGEVLWIFGPDDAHAIRCMIDGPVTWTQDGTVADVVAALAKVQHPGQPGAPLTAVTVGLPVIPKQETRPGS
jgi:hypothetical protein